MAKRTLTIITTMATMLLINAPLWAQCPLCRTAAAAASEETATALNSAIVVLLTPAVLMFCGVFAFAFRARNKAESHDDEGADW